MHADVMFYSHMIIIIMIVIIILRIIIITTCIVIETKLACDNSNYTHEEERKKLTINFF